MDGYLQFFLQQFQHLKIQLEEIILATNNFDTNNRIGVGGFGPVYRGEVSHSEGRSMVAIKRLDPKHGQGMPEFLKEITMLSNYRHENLISLLGFCCEGREMILLYELASRGSLDSHLNSPHLSWTQRIKICLDAAKGISYLHDPRATHQRLIHCDLKSANILLDGDWNAKVSDFGLSIMGSANAQQSVIVTLAAGTQGYIDPMYRMTNTLTKESDVYSFGVVMFEILCGTLCSTYNNGRLQILVPVWIESFRQKNLNDIIFKSPTIFPLDQSALEILLDIAYRCLKGFREDRPKMSEVVTVLETAIEIQEFSDWIHLFDSKKMTKTAEPLLNHTYNAVLRKLLSKGVLRNGETTFLQQFQHLEIQLEEITLATNNFSDENYTGSGGFGELYEGVVCHSNGRSMVTIKRLDRRNGEGTPEFLKEIATLSRYSHQNLISLLGFCCQGSEMIVVYDHVSRESLGRHLNSPRLNWSQRLKICLDAAKGLSYLHDPRETRPGLIHCGVKSSNILLVDEWNTKVSNLGLSVMDSANEQQPVIVTLAACTEGYIDPQYQMTHALTKESDVYSFGVVLFEVLCGKSCCTYSNGRVSQILVPMWTESYKEKKLIDIIFKLLIPLDQGTFKIVSDIAYQCLKVSREDRPKMAEVVAELERALESQKISSSYESIVINMNYRSNGELAQILSKGVLLNEGKTWFSLNEKGEHCEMISFASCVLENYYRRDFQTEYNNSRFVVGSYYMSYNRTCKIHVETQFLSPGITYTVNLMFKFMLPMKKTEKCYNDMHFTYRLDGADQKTFSYVAFEKKDGWWECGLCQFTSDNRCVDFDIEFCVKDKDIDFIEAEGIEFLPLENVEHKEEKQPISDLDANWEDKLPTDFEEIMERSTNSMQWTTKKEAYSLICKGLLIDDGEKWFSLDKNGKKCHMLSARFLSYWYDDDVNLKIMASPESRFGEVLQFHGIWCVHYFVITSLDSHLVSSQTTYASYLIYKLPKDQSRFQGPFTIIDCRGQGDNNKWYIYLTRPQTPLLRPKANQNTHNPANRLNFKGLQVPRLRNDGWMEVQIWEFHTATNTEKIKMNFHLTRSDLFQRFTGLIVQGIEFRPI